MKLAGALSICIGLVAGVMGQRGPVNVRAEVLELTLEQDVWLEGKGEIELDFRRFVGDLALVDAISS